MEREISELRKTLKPQFTSLMIDPSHKVTNYPGLPGIEWFPGMQGFHCQAGKSPVQQGHIGHSESRIGSLLDFLGNFLVG